MPAWNAGMFICLFVPGLLITALCISILTEHPSGLLKITRGIQKRKHKRIWTPAENYGCKNVIKETLREIASRFLLRYSKTNQFFLIRLAIKGWKSTRILPPILLLIMKRRASLNRIACMFELWRIKPKIGIEGAAICGNSPIPFYVLSLWPNLHLKNTLNKGRLCFQILFSILNQFYWV